MSTAAPANTTTTTLAPAPAQAGTGAPQPAAAQAAQPQPAAEPVQGAGGGDGGGGGGGGPGDGGQPPQGGQPAAGFPGNFALTPSRANDGILDYTNASHVKLYKAACAPLPQEFDLSAEHLKLFLENFKQRAFVSNWTTTLMVPPGAAQHNLHLIDNYGRLSLSQIQTWAASYLYTNSRNAQNSVMMLECLSSTLTEGARQRVALRAKDYTIDLPPFYPGPPLMDGLLHFKVVIMLATIDTRATITTIRMRLSSLDTKIHEMDDNINEFNDCVNTQLAQLEARGQDTQDLLVNLFKAYATVADAKFTSYIEQRENEYNDGKDIEPVALMDLARNKYATLVESGRWKEQTADQKKLVALAAQVAHFKKQANKSNGGNNGGGDGKGKGKQGDGNDGGKKKEGKPKKKKEWAEWKVTNKDNKKTMTRKDTLYYWCIHHNDGKGLWVTHKPEDCNMAKKKKKQQEEKDSKTNEPTLKVKGMAAILSDDEEFP